MIAFRLTGLIFRPSAIVAFCWLGCFGTHRPACAAPANDAFANRASLTGATNFVVASNVGATVESGEPHYYQGQPGGSSVWWTWTAPTSGSFSASTDGSSFDTLLGVYRGSKLTNLIALVSDDDSGSNGASRVVFRAIAGEAYQIAVDGFQGDSGEINLSLGPSGYPAPGWSVHAPNSSTGAVYLAQFTNKVILLDFFETTCGACTNETPDLLRLRSQLASRGFEMVGLAKDTDQANVAANLHYLGITFPVGLSTSTVEASYANNASGVVPMPTKFLIDREGKIQMTIVGGNSFYFYQSLVTPLLTGAANLQVNARRQPGNILLSWPATEFGWVVDTATNGLQGLWTQITGLGNETNDGEPITWPATVVVTNGQNTVTLPRSGTASFYRLRKKVP